MAGKTRGELTDFWGRLDVDNGVLGGHNLGPPGVRYSVFGSKRVPLTWFGTKLAT